MIDQLLSDGGKVNGSFWYDPDNDVFSPPLSLQTTAGSVFGTGTNYVDPPECNYALMGSLTCSDTTTGRIMALASTMTPNLFSFQEIGTGTESSAVRTGTGPAFEVVASPVVVPPAAVPEPGTVALMVTGLAGLGYRRFRRQTRA